MSSPGPRAPGSPPTRPAGSTTATRRGTPGWPAGRRVLTVALALLPLALTPVLPQLDAAGLTVAMAVCTVVGGVVGQLPVDRAFRWTRRQTGPGLAHQAARLAAQLASAAVGLVVALVVLAQLDRSTATPQGVAVAVLVAGFGIAVVDLARTGTVAELRVRAARRRGGDGRRVLGAGRARRPVRPGIVDDSAGRLVRRGADSGRCGGACSSSGSPPNSPVTPEANGAITRSARWCSPPLRPVSSTGSWPSRPDRRRQEPDAQPNATSANKSTWPGSVEVGKKITSSVPASW